MGHPHHHAHSHAADHHGRSDTRLVAAVCVNGALTVVQVIGGLLSGSLSLLADALHNLSDAGALVIALVARRIGRRPADYSQTFGYRRAELVGAVINATTLNVVGLYLLYEAALRRSEEIGMQLGQSQILATLDRLAEQQGQGEAATQYRQRADLVLPDAS